MMKMSEQFGSGKWLAAADLNNRAHIVTINQVAVVNLDERDGSTSRKVAVYFNGAGKALILNATNNLSITEMYGDESDNWIGKPVELYVAKVMFGPNQVDAIRVRPPAGATPANTGALPNKPALPDPASPSGAPAAQAQAPVVPGGDLDDSVPF